MYLNRRPNQSSARGMAALALTPASGAPSADPLSVRAQDPAVPDAAADVLRDRFAGRWTRGRSAVTDSLGSTAGAAGHVRRRHAARE